MNLLIYILWLFAFVCVHNGENHTRRNKEEEQEEEQFLRYLGKGRTTTHAIVFSW